MGAIVCLVIVGLFAFLVMRTFARLLAEKNLFVFLAVAGLVTHFGLQAVVNLGSSLHLLPTKGMTLKLGSASCWERVCQYVSIAGVAVSFNTHNTRNRKLELRLQ